VFTIDTSVFVADLTPTESGHAESRALLDRLRADGTPLILPTLLLVELAGVIGRVHGDPERAWRVVTNLSTNPQATFVALDETLALRAADLAASHRLRGADAVYVGVAQQAGCPLVTLDAEQLRRVAGVITAQTPAAALSSLPHAPDP